MGATRIVMGENWRVEIEKLIFISQAVIVEANYTENLLWELQLIKKSSRPEKLIISFLSRDEYYESEATMGQLINLGRDTKSHYEKFDNAPSRVGQRRSFAASTALSNEDFIELSNSRQRAKSPMPFCDQ
jgi:hypothetical protein